MKKWLKNRIPTCREVRYGTLLLVSIICSNRLGYQAGIQEGELRTFRAEVDTKWYYSYKIPNQEGCDSTIESDARYDSWDEAVDSAYYQMQNDSVTRYQDLNFGRTFVAKDKE